MEREDISNPLAATIGRTRLLPHYWSPGDNGDLIQKLDGNHATRVYLYLDLSPIAEYRTADRLKFGAVRDELDIKGEVSQSTEKTGRVSGSFENRRFP
jgi:hypothetical protein